MKKIKYLMLALVALFAVSCAKNETKKEDVKPEKKVENKVNFEGKTLNVVATSEKYKKLFDKFTEETKAKVEFLSMSSGEVISRIKAEGGKPMADVWFGGGIDAFMKAKADGLLEMYKPEGFDKIKEGFKDSEGFWISKGVTVVGFLANNKLLEEKNLPVPKTWEELIDAKYKDEIIMANPAVSGTSYGNVKGLIDLYGEEKAWDYFAKLNDNVKFYGKRGKDPQEKVVAGEFAIGIIPIDKSAFDVAEKNNLTAIYPDHLCWVPEGVAIFKNSPNLDVAKAFEDFILRAENQQLIAELDGKDGAQMVIDGTKGFELGLPKDKFIKEDLTTFGSKRADILKRWEELTKGK